MDTNIRDYNEASWIGLLAVQSFSMLVTIILSIIYFTKFDEFYSDALKAYNLKNQIEIKDINKQTAEIELEIAIEIRKKKEETDKQIREYEIQHEDLNRRWMNAGLGELNLESRPNFDNDMMGLYDIQKIEKEIEQNTVKKMNAPKKNKAIVMFIMTFILTSFGDIYSLIILKSRFLETQYLYMRVKNKDNSFENYLINEKYFNYDREKFSVNKTNQYSFYFSNLLNETNWTIAENFDLTKC